MIRTLLKLVLIVVILVGIGAFLLGRRSGDWTVRSDSTPHDTIHVDTSKAREVGAKVGEATANAANEAENALANGSVTAKIKSKMALDELVKATNINVDTNGSIVTLTGVVDSQAERQRAVELARETAGVTSVIDHLRMK